MSGDARWLVFIGFHCRVRDQNATGASIAFLEARDDDESLVGRLETIYWCPVGCVIQGIGWCGMQGWNAVRAVRRRRTRGTLRCRAIIAFLTVIRSLSAVVLLDN